LLKFTKKETTVTRQAKTNEANQTGPKMNAVPPLKDAIAEAGTKKSLSDILPDSPAIH
jgi:hypothetical protein